MFGRAVKSQTKNNQVHLVQYPVQFFSDDSVITESICYRTREIRGLYDWRADKKLDGMALEYFQKKSDNT